VGHRLGLATKTQISVCKSPFPSAGTAVSLLRAKTVQQRPLDGSTIIYCLPATPEIPATLFDGQHNENRKTHTYRILQAAKIMEEHR